MITSPDNISYYLEKAKYLDEVSILLENNEHYSKMAKANNPYGDGQTCKYIIDALKQLVTIRIDSHFL